MFLGSCSTLLLLLLSVLGTVRGYFKFEDCTPKVGGIAKVGAFELKPDPLVLYGNMSNTISVEFESDVPETAVVRTLFYKVKDVLGVEVDEPIPCVYEKFGTCTMSFCHYLDQFRNEIEPMWPEGRKYGCPVQAGRYGGQNVEVPLPDLPHHPYFELRGKYRTEIVLLDEPEGGMVLACFNLWTELK